MFGWSGLAGISHSCIQVCIGRVKGRASPERMKTGQSGVANLARRPLSAGVRDPSAPPESRLVGGCGQD